MGSSEIGFPEIGLPEISSTEICLPEIGPTQLGSKEVDLKTEIPGSPLIPNLDSMLQNLYLFPIGHRLILSTSVSPPILLRPAYPSP